MVSKKVATYDPRQVIVTFGSHTASGYSEDGFISIEKQGDGVKSKVGCDGEMVRALDPNESYKIAAKFLQSSATNKFLLEQYQLDNETGEGTFPVTIKDLRGSLLFSADIAWAVKPTKYEYGKEAGEREWEIETGPGTLKQD